MKSMQSDARARVMQADDTAPAEGRSSGGLILVRSRVERCGQTRLHTLARMVALKNAVLRKLEATTRQLINEVRGSDSVCLAGAPL